MTIDTFLFALDGTLVDSVLDLAAGTRTCFCAWEISHHGDSPYDDLATTPQDLLRIDPGGAQ